MAGTSSSAYRPIEAIATMGIRPQPSLLPHPPPPPPPRDALEGKGPRRPPQRRLDRRLEEVAKAFGGGDCQLHMPLRLAFGVRGTVAGHGPAPWRGGGGGHPPPFQCIPAPLPLLPELTLITPTPPHPSPPALHAPRQCRRVRWRPGDGWSPVQNLFPAPPPPRESPTRRYTDCSVVVDCSVPLGRWRFCRRGGPTIVAF